MAAAKRRYWFLVTYAIGPALLVLGYFIHAHEQQVRSRLATTTGTVSRSTYEKRKNSWLLDLRYAYLVKDKLYEGDQIGFAVSSYDSEEEAKKALDPYPVGKQVTVHYDRAKPSRAVLDPEADGNGVIVLFLGGLVLVILTPITFLIRRGQRRAEAPPHPEAGPASPASTFSGSPADRVVIQGTTGAQLAFRIVLLVIGPVVLLVALVLLADGAVHAGLSAAGFGLFLLLAALLVGRNPGPPRLTFDLGARQLLVEEDRPRVRSETLPFEDLVAFGVVKRRIDRSSRYDVCLFRRDASYWCLDSFGSEEDARRRCDELNFRVPLAAVPGVAPPPAGSPAPGIPVEPFTVTTSGGTTVITWRPPVTPGGAVLGLLCVGSLVLGVVSCVVARGASGAATTAVIIGSVVAAFLTYVILAHALVREVLEINPKTLSYRREGRLYLPGRFERSLAQVAAVQFFWSAPESMGSTGAMLYVLGESELEPIRKAQQGSAELAENLSGLAAELGAAKVRMSGLGLVDMIRLERLVQTIIAARSGREVR